MRRVFLSLAVVLALLLGTHGTALAVTNGIPDGEQHPYVGLLIFSDGENYWRCSGSLLSPTVVLAEAADVSTFAALPTVGYVDTLDMGTWADVVGYGVQQRAVGGGRPFWFGTLT